MVLTSCSSQAPQPVDRSTTIYISTEKQPIEPKSVSEQSAQAAAEAMCSSESRSLFAAAISSSNTEKQRTDQLLRRAEIDQCSGSSMLPKPTQSEEPLLPPKYGAAPFVVTPDSWGNEFTPPVPSSGRGDAENAIEVSRNKKPHIGTDPPLKPLSPLSALTPAFALSSKKLQTARLPTPQPAAPLTVERYLQGHRDIDVSPVKMLSVVTPSSVVALDNAPTALKTSEKEK